MSIIYLLAITLLVGYMLLMAIYLYGWLRIKQTVYAKEQSSEYETYTILLSVRNEEKNVRKCLEYILTQKYPADKLEVIVINDHSTDNTELEVQSLIQSNPHYKIRLFNLS
jgi:cellulose synthase/poly-beta-1,6-N-acetylglucosamine synthase-like glycosyltransferase